MRFVLRSLRLPLVVFLALWICGFGIDYGFDAFIQLTLIYIMINNTIDAFVGEEPGRLN